jgi:hypothetical protein
MDRDEFDIFEKLPDGSFVWKCVASGLGEACLKLGELSRATRNELRVIHMPSKSIVVRTNVSRPSR